MNFKKNDLGDGGDVSFPDLDPRHKMRCVLPVLSVGYHQSGQIQAGAITHARTHTRADTSLYVCNNLESNVKPHFTSPYHHNPMTFLNLSATDAG